MNLPSWLNPAIGFDAAVHRGIANGKGIANDKEIATDKGVANGKDIPAYRSQLRLLPKETIEWHL
jgi:hypothetical protein